MMGKKQDNKCSSCNKKSDYGIWVHRDRKPYLLCSNCYFSHCLEREKKSIYKKTIIEEGDKKTDV